MLIHDKCGAFELKILELERVLKIKETIIIEMQNKIAYLEDRLNESAQIKDDKNEDTQHRRP